MWEHRSHVNRPKTGWQLASRDNREEKVRRVEKGHSLELPYADRVFLNPRALCAPGHCSAWSRHSCRFNWLYGRGTRAGMKRAVAEWYPTAFLLVERIRQIHQTFNLWGDQDLILS